MELRIWRYFDLYLLLSMVFLVVFGVTMIYSATYGTSGAAIDPLVYHQALYAAMGLLLFVALSGVDYHMLANLSWLAYVGSIGALAAVLGIGRVLHGAQRWIQVAGFEFQPSEVAKLCLILALSRFLARYADQLKNPRVLAGSFAIAALPAALVYLEPDFGTSTVYLAIWLAMTFAAGVPYRYYLGLLGVTLVASPAVWFALRPYQQARLLTFLDPQSDPTGEGYNAIQALISVGSGGFFGRGFLSGSQSQLHFLRVQYADFIFSVLGEELGFLGATGLLLLFTVLILRGLRAASFSREIFGRLVCCGVIAAIAYQLVVNVGMNVGLLPITGIPLPMISYGGTSVVTFMGSLGILESVVMRHRKFGF
jgi:rod shape determining protein RodA